MKQHVYWFISLLIFLFACGGRAPEGPDQTLVIPTAVSPTQTADSAPTLTAPETAAATPAATVPAPGPAFTNLRFTTAAANPPQTTFDPGTEEVFALWEYAHLTANDRMKRVWTKNGAGWLVREEAWDFTTHGAAGTLSDISVYDFEGSGLEPGAYSLTLYLNDQPQLSASFEILAPPTTAGVTLSASTETILAQVIEDNTLVIQEPNGRQLLQFEATEIVDLVWFADGQHLLYVDRDRSEQVADSTIGIKHALWLVDVPGETRWQLGSFAEDLHAPQVSTNGRYISTIAGSGYVDACFADRQLYIMALDDQWQRTALYELADFAGAPLDNQVWVFPFDDGKWHSDTEWDVYLNAYCLPVTPESETDGAPLPAVYRLNLETLRAVPLDNNQAILKRAWPF